MSLFRVGPRKARTFVAAALAAGLVPFLQASPGVGKSSIVRSIAESAGLEMLDVRMSTHEPSDVTGLPRFIEDRAVLTPFKDMFPLDGDPLPPGKQGWLLFLDEFNSASKQMQAACYKLILDRMVGLAKLHPAVHIVCAGNLVTDRAIVTSLSTAMQSRLVHIEMEVVFDEWLQDVALPQKYDPRIVAYLSANPGHLLDFRPDHQDKTFCCPRTWEFMNRLVEDNPVTDEYAPLYAGTITSLVATNFIQFTRVFDSLVKVDDVLANPLHTPVPTDVPARWAITTMLLEQVDVHNFGTMVQYANRFDTSFLILFIRGALARIPNVRTVPAFASAAAPIAAYLV